MAHRGFLIGMLGALGAALVSSLVFLAAGAGPAGAAFPGENGKIAFTNEPVLGWDLDFPETGPTDVWVTNPDGSGQANLTATPEQDEATPAFSPDGTRIAFWRGGEGAGVWVMAADGSEQRRLADGHAPQWSPDGEEIAFLSGGDLWIMDADGTDQRRLTDGPDADAQHAFSPDGTKILFVRTDPGTSGWGKDVWTVGADGTGQRNLTDTPGHYEVNPAFSPDGAEVAFESCRVVQFNCSPDRDIRVVGTNGSGGRNVTDGFDSEEVDPWGQAEPYQREMDEYSPAWSPDGEEIAFASESLTRCTSDVFSVDADAPSAWANLTGFQDQDSCDEDLPPSAGSPAYSPDGEKIVFGGADGYQYSLVGVMGRDGSGREWLDAPGFAGDPDWQPVCPCPPVPEPRDDTDPAITSPHPSAGSRVRDRTPTVRATVHDETSELDKADITLRVDGKAKRFSYDPGTDRLSRATNKLSYGRHTVKVTATDEAGNEAARAWSFRVVRR